MKTCCSITAGRPTGPVRFAVVLLVALVPLQLTVPVRAGGSPSGSGILEQWTTLHASDGVAGDQFGYSVSVSGDVVIVGAIFADGATASSGTAYIFRRNGSAWIQEQKLIPADGQASGDWFGFSVAVSGDVAVVGAPRTGDDGSAYVFTWTGDAWQFQKRLVASSPGGQFGSSVSVSGDVIFVGAPYATVLGQVQAGQVVGFRRVDDDWIEEATLHGVGGVSPGDRLGHSVSVFGNAVFAGAPFSSTGGGGPRTGSVTVFEEDPTWKFKEGVIAVPESSYGGFGHSVSVSNDAAVVGSPDADMAFVYRRQAFPCVNCWTGTRITPPDAALESTDFGASVSLSGEVAVVGAPLDGPFDQGAAFVFRWEESTEAWVQTRKLLVFAPPVDQVLQKFGTSVSVSGEVAVVGVPTVSAGSVFVYDLSRPDACGNGVVNSGEECDDLNQELGDGCTPSCLFEPYCGDGSVSGLEETCDPPGVPGGANGEDCRADCTVCGDGILEDGATAIELIENGGFESWGGDSPSAWLVAAPGGLVTQEANGVFAGSSAIRLQRTGAGTLRVQQNLSGLASGGSYALSFWAKTDGPPSALTPRIKFLNVSLGEYLGADGNWSTSATDLIGGGLAVDGSWQKFTVAFTTPAGHSPDDLYRIWLQHTAAPIGLLFDQVSLVGYLGDGEGCDDGNDVDDDACGVDCVANFCGDGETNNGEACDDGNNVENDACANDCTENLDCTGLDTDSDGVPDACDCLTGDASWWSVPGEVSNLVLSHLGGATGTTTLQWSAPTSLGGEIALYDLVVSSLADDLTAAAAVCAESAEPDTTATDTSELAAGEIRFFVVRASGECGNGSGGELRVLRDCT